MLILTPTSFSVASATASGATLDWARSGNGQQLAEHGTCAASLLPAGSIAIVHGEDVLLRSVALEDAEVLGRIRQLGGDVFADASQQSAGQFIAAQQALWAKLIKDRHITTG